MTPLLVCPVCQDASAEQRDGYDNAPDLILKALVEEPANFARYAV